MTDTASFGASFADVSCHVLFSFLEIATHCQINRFQFQVKTRQWLAVGEEREIARREQTVDISSTLMSKTLT